jgi:zinc transporter ZupT
MVAIEGSVLSWSLVGAGLVAGAVILAGMIGGVVAWIGALLNCAQLKTQAPAHRSRRARDPEPRFLAIIAWVVAGPDRTAGRTGSRSQGGPIPTPASPA